MKTNDKLKKILANLRDEIAAKGSDEWTKEVQAVQLNELGEFFYQSLSYDFNPHFCEISTVEFSDADISVYVYGSNFDLQLSPILPPLQMSDAKLASNQTAVKIEIESESNEFSWDQKRAKAA